MVKWQRTFFVLAIISLLSSNAIGQDYEQTPIHKDQINYYLDRITYLVEGMVGDLNKSNLAANDLESIKGDLKRALAEEVCDEIKFESTERNNASCELPPTQIKEISYDNLYHKKLAAHHIGKNEYQKAIAVYEKILQKNPNDAITHYNLGLLYEHFYNDSGKALFHITEYLRLKPYASNKKLAEFLVKAIKESP
ncbi:MAG: tetratricopeptide repeat protein [Candidatus Omnitrophica bacterium]|nr:tetratricopeptide repeat protein [Candidatus Omnitrophota bacterium]